MPETPGETLTGKRVVPAHAVQGHEAILVAGFSHDGGVQCGPLMKAIQDDPAFKGISAWELAMLERAPGMFRGVIKSGMRKDLSTAQQDQVVVITQDQKLWEKFFGVDDNREPYVLLLDAKGNVAWRGHGPAATLETLLRSALKQ
jgi:hypothetical protein